VLKTDREAIVSRGYDDVITHKNISRHGCRDNHQQTGEEPVTQGS